MDTFDAVCPRCGGRGISPQTPPAQATPSGVERLKKEALATESTSETIGGSFKGGLLFLLPALITALVFLVPMGMLHSTGGSASAGTVLLSVVFGFLLCACCGAGVGAWVGSGFPLPQVKKAATVGAAIAVALAFVAAFCGYLGSRVLMDICLLSLLVGVIICGAYGGAERQRNGRGESDGELLARFGVGLLCACLPVMGVILIVVLNRNGSDKASAALWGTLLGVALPCLLLLVSFLVAG